MPAKHIALDMNHDPIERKKPQSKSKVVWDDRSEKEYWLLRDRLWYKDPNICDETKQAIRERYNI